MLIVLSFLGVQFAHAGFLDDFSDGTKIESMFGLSRDSSEIKLADATNSLDDPDHLLLSSGLGSTEEITNAGGNPSWQDAFDDSRHYDTDASMTGYYQFSGDVSPVVDSTGNGSGALSSPAPTHTGEHYDFNSAGPNYITIGSNIVPSGSWTIMAWVNVSSTYNTNEIWFSQGSCYFRITSSPAFKIYCGAIGGDINGPALTYDQWYHIAVTYQYGASNDGVLRLYVNNFTSDSAQYVDGNNLNINGTTSGNIATGGTAMGRYSAGGYNFNGSLDEVAIYNRALTASEVLAQYNNTHNDTYSNLTHPAGVTGNASALDSTTTLTFPGDNFYGPKGTIVFRLK